MDVLSTYSLSEQPFAMSPNPRFFYVSDTLAETIAKCEYMAANRVGPLYIYGPIGSGKTTLLRTLRARFEEDDSYVVSSIISANIKTSNAFLRVIMNEFEVKTARAYDRSLDNFNAYLIDQYKNGQTPLLLVDEAQNLVRDTLRLVHYLLNFETDTEKLLQIVLVGQEDLATKVMRYRELASRMFPIAINAMSPDELEKMIRFRWMVAGGQELPFADGVFDRVFAHSKGLPRDAVKLCDEALRHAALQDQPRISPGLVDTIAVDLNLSI